MVNLKINGIPDVYYYKDGKIIAHETGFDSKDMIMARLTEILY